MLGAAHLSHKVSKYNTLCEQFWRLIAERQGLYRRPSCPRAASLHHRGAGSLFGVSPAAAKLALLRLAKQRLVASPARGFYVIVPPEYKRLGCLPADQFIPQLMERLGLPYYAGLLTAAQYHGAAHHRPQEFQVVLPKNRRPIACGAVRVAFVARKRRSRHAGNENSGRSRLPDRSRSGTWTH